jgi:hypothetical protein
LTPVTVSSWQEENRPAVRAIYAQATNEADQDAAARLGERFFGQR